MHEYYLENERGDLIDAIPLCSDACHRAYAGKNYAGWSGCHELEHTDYCRNCGVVIPGLEGACECQSRNVVVNRFLSEGGEKCKHGNWIQLPLSYFVPDEEEDARDNDRSNHLRRYRLCVLEDRPLAR